MKIFVVAILAALMLLNLSGCEPVDQDCMPFPDNHADHHRPSTGV